MRNKPELDIADARAKIANGENLLTEKQITFLASVEDGSTVLELNGGLGLVAEYLSARAKVRLCDDGRLYFTYRRQIFPESKVTEMNISPYMLSTNNKLTDYVVIHNLEFLEIAKKLAKKSVISMSDLSIIKPEVKNETVNINSPADDGSVTKDSGDKRISQEQSNTNSNILNDEMQESNGDVNIDNANIEPVLDME